MLQDRLDEIGMSQIQLAEKTRKSPQWVSDIVNDRHKLSLKNAKLIADAVGCHIDDLYIWHGSKPNRNGK
ncbi:MAG: helix-turn-helix domain-containing protein [Bacillus sp. (in: firmicutes)]